MKGNGEDTVTIEEIDFEIARDNPAAVHLSKILRLEQMPQLTMSLGSDDQRQVNFVVTLVKQLHEEAGKEGDPITIEGVLDKCIE